MFRILCTLIVCMSPLSALASADIDTTIATALKKLPGHTGCAVTEISGKSPKLLYGVRPDEKFAVGSTFKLFILGTLADEVNKGRRELENSMRLSAELIGPPTSELATWPIGAPVTLNTLALKMISISDNTATDHLHYLLTPQRIERQMVTMGNKHPEWNIPLLSTRQMVMLRNKKEGMPGKEYDQLDVRARRLFLAKHFSGVVDFERLDFDTGAYDIAEWYATPLDMAAALTWIKQHTNEKDKAHLLRAILAIDSKLEHDPKIWPYVGFKGGSEDQLLAGNWLLKHQNGKWYTFHVYWNNPDGNAEPPLLIEAVNTIFAAVQGSLQD